MNNLNIEKHFLKNRALLPVYLAQGLLLHAGLGKVAIITSSPLQLLKSTKGEWFKLTKRSGVSLRFTATVPDDLLDADITFATSDNFLRVPPICQTIYVTQGIEKQELYVLTSWMPPRSLVVIYE